VEQSREFLVKDSGREKIVARGKGGLERSLEQGTSRSSCEPGAAEFSAIIWRAIFARGEKGADGGFRK